MPIERNATEQEKEDYIPLDEKDPVKSGFYNELAKRQEDAAKKKLPFAYREAKQDFDDAHKRQIEDNKRRNGYLVLGQLKPVKLDWKVYSDLANFTLVKEDEIANPEASRKLPGLNVTEWRKVYRFKDYFGEYQIMEDPNEAILRARRKLAEIENLTKKK